MLYLAFCIFFFFNDTATTEIYTLSLHDALPILTGEPGSAAPSNVTVCSTGSRLVQRTACPAEMVMASPANFTAVMLTSAATAAPDAPSATGLGEPWNHGLKRFKCSGIVNSKP